MDLHQNAGVMQLLTDTKAMSMGLNILADRANVAEKYYAGYPADVVQMHHPRAIADVLFCVARDDKKVLVTAWPFDDTMEPQD